MKKFRGILAILLIMILCFQAGAHMKHSPTQNSLSIAYREINREFFYGGLPENKTTVLLTDLSKDDYMGYTDHRADGSWVILIDKESHPREKEAEMTLIHEMCHQENIISHNDEGIDGHSLAFQACMLSKAKNGAFEFLW
jgi:hypothetical protein